MRAQPILAPEANLSRRQFLAAAGAATAGLSGGLGRSRAAGLSERTNTGEERSMAASYLAYVGCRTTRERNARGDGINVYRLNGETAAWTHVQLVGDLLNPSFLAFDRRQRCLYTVHGDSSEISAFPIDPRSGELAFLNRQSTRGKNPVHLTTDPTNRFIVVANHVTAGDYVSSLAVLALNQDGSLGALTDHMPLKGKLGPHRIEQPFAKPHQVQYDPSDRFIAVPGKGLDLVVTYTIDAAGKLKAIDAPPAHAREGAGPRHVGFHPRGPYAYVLNELDSTVMACQFASKTGALAPFQVLSSLPDTFVGDSRASEIEVSRDGRFVYASNRGYDSVAIFAVDEGTGRLSAVAWQESAGKTPRFFALDPTGRRMFVTNEDSDTIVAFDVDQDTGALTNVGTAAQVGSPTCILFRA